MRTSHANYFDKQFKMCASVSTTSYNEIHIHTHTTAELNINIETTLRCRFSVLRLSKTDNCYD